MAQNIREAVECFHLLLLEQLARKIDKRCYALKGGCNLRFFFKSVRYSEDMDFDVRYVSVDTLAKNINQLFSSRPFQQILAARGIQIQFVNAATQTETTQRWKISLIIPSSTIPVNTKIEFSRRKFDDDVVLEKIDPVLVQHYQTMPFLANHYSRDSAIEQKIDALVHRNTTQARDIFDLHLLLNASTAFIPTSFSDETLKQGINNAMSVSIDQFISQVVAYLPDEYIKYYSDKEVWDKMAENVKNFLQGGLK